MCEPTDTILEDGSSTQDRKLMCEPTDMILEEGSSTQDRN